jgi:hypothetical protein
LFTQRQDTLGGCGGPGGLTYVARPMRALFQSAEIVPVEAAQPAIKGLAADAKMPTSACGVPPIEEIKKHPLKSSSRPAAQSSSHLIWLILTLYRVSPIILNEHNTGFAGLGVTHGFKELGSDDFPRKISQIRLAAALGELRPE